MNRAPVSPVSLRNDLPRELERIIHKALEKDRALRYQHADEIRDDLSRLKQAGTSNPGAAAAASPKRPIMRWLPLAMLAVLILAGLWLRFAGGSGSKKYALAESSREQKLEGQEFPAVSFLEASLGQAAAAENSLRLYAEACPWMTPAGIDLFRARNQLISTLPLRPSRVPWFPEHWMPLYEARAALAQKGYSRAEQLLHRTLFLHRWLLTFVGQRHRSSPLVSQLCRFHLGQGYEATAKRGQAADEYRMFLSSFEGSPTRLPQLADARDALKRLGAPCSSFSLPDASGK